MKNNSSNLHDSVVIEATSYSKLLCQFEDLVASSDYSPVQELTSAKTSSISLIPTSLQNVTSHKVDGSSHPAPTITVSATRNENSLPRKLSLVSNGIIKKLVKNKHGISVSSLLRDPRVKVQLETDVQCNGTVVNGISNQNQVNVTSITDVENSDPLHSNVLNIVRPKMAGNQTIRPNGETNQTGNSALNDTKGSTPPIVLPELSVTSPVKRSASTDEFPDLLKPQNLTRYVELSSLKSQDNNSSKKPTIQYRPYYSHLRDHDYTLNCSRFIPKEKSTSTISSSSSTTKRSFIIPKKKKKISDDQCLDNSVSNNSNKDSDDLNIQEYFSNDTQTNSLKLENENSSSPNIQTANSPSSPLLDSSDNTKDVLHEEKQETAEVSSGFESVEKQNVSSCGLSALHDYVTSENPFDCRNVDNHDFRTCDVCKDFFPKPKSGEKCNDDVFPDMIPCQMCCHLSEDNLTANYVKHCNVNSPLGHLNPCGLLSCPTDEAINAYIFDYPNDKELEKISSTDVEGILDSDMLGFKSLKTIDQNHFNLKNSLDLLIAPSLRHNQELYENFCNFPNERIVKDISGEKNEDNLKENILNENDFLFISEPVKKSVNSSSTKISDQAVNENTSNNENSPMEEDPRDKSDETEMSIDNEGSEEVLLNKVPIYLNGLSTEAINSKVTITYQDFIENPSPEHETELCKIPAYHQSFGNSIKYDINSPSLVHKYPWSERSKSAIRHHQQFDSDCETSKSCLSSSSSPSPSDSPTEEFPSWSQSSSRSTSPSSDSRSGQFSPYSDYTSSRDRSPSPYSQHRSSYSLQKVLRHNRNYTRIRSPYRYSNHHKSRRRSSMVKYQDLLQDERRIVYVGKLPLNYTSNQLKELFSKWGPVENVSLHFREHQDNYGFVTFYHQSDAYLSMDATSKIKDFPFDVCFGGRRTFCQESYADLDGLVEDEEEFGTVIKTSNMSFEQLLKEWKRERKH